MAENVIRIVVEGSTGGGGTGGTRGGSTGSSAETKNIFDLQRKLRAELKATADEQGNWSAKTVETKKRLEEVNKKIRELNNLGKENKNTWANAFSSYQFKFNALGNIVANFTSFAVNSLKQLGSTVVTISKDFEFAMSGVKAITQATDAEFKALYSDAVRLGGATLFTAKQFAEFQTELAKLGFSVKEIRSATDGVVALAAATGEDLGQSALVAGTIIRGFNLDASELTRVVDVMAQSFNASALDLYKFAETMKYVAPVASKTGFTVSEVTAMMAKLADQGVVASQAGTSLRNLLLRLADANSKLAKAIGFPVKSLPELVIGLQKLNEAGLDATRALQLADRYSVTALLGLAQQADGIWELYKSLISTAGAAERMSETRMDNFAGEIDKLKGSWDALVLTINKSNGALRRAVEGVRGFVEWMTKAFQSEDQTISELASKRVRYSDDRLNRELANIDKQMTVEMDAVYNSTKTEKEKIAEFERINKDYEQRRKTARATELQTEKNYAQQQIELFRVTVDNTIGKEKEKAERSLAVYTQYLENLNERESEARKQALVDAFNEFDQAAEDYSKKAADLRIELMEDGLERELAILENHYIEWRQKAIEYGVSLNLVEEKYWRDKLEIVEKYALLYEGIVIDDDGNVLMSALVGKLPEKGKIDEQFKKAVDEEERRLKEVRGRMAKQTSVVTEQRRSPNIFEQLGITELTSEQRQALEKGVNFVTDQIQKIADKEVEMADRRVENSERVVEQLQRDLEIEFQLKEKGLANNVSLKQRELAEAKKQQEKALALQEEALQKQRVLEQASQTIDLLSATASILKNSFKTGEPISASILAAAALAGMWGTWAWSLSQANSATKYAEGGEIVGAKHSSGGVPIEAEGGEFVVKASAYSKHADLVQAINNDNMSQVYSALNKDLSVSLDDSKYERMMGRYFGNKRRTYHNGYYIEQIGNRTRKIKYAV